MPLYDLQCKVCEHTYEAFHLMDTRFPVKCPECGKKQVVRTFINPPAAHNTYSPMHPRKNRGRGY